MKNLCLKAGLGVRACVCVFEPQEVGFSGVQWHSTLIDLCIDYKYTKLIADLLGNGFLFYIHTNSLNSFQFLSHFSEAEVE